MINLVYDLGHVFGLLFNGRQLLSTVSALPACLRQQKTTAGEATLHARAKRS